MKRSQAGKAMSTTDLGSSDLDASKLILYKNLSSQAEMRKIHFYVQVIANQTTISPLLLGQYNGLNYGGNDPREVDYYYNLIGTTRRVELAKQMSQLQNLTVDRSRVKYQLNLDECQITQDPVSWNRQRNLVPLQQADGTWIPRSSYNLINVLGPQPTSGQAYAKQNVSYQYFQEATRTVVPEPLFVRVKELTDEPYQWVTQPSGEVSLDKSHQPIVIDDIYKYPSFTIEFGHLTFNGSDEQYIEYADSYIQPNAIDNFNWSRDGNSNERTKPDIRKYEGYTYTDFNQELQNVSLAPDIAAPSGTNRNNEFVYPGNRSAALAKIENDFGAPLSDKILMATKPLKSNQQVSSILMKFSITVLPLW
jgi:hypothetical protein